MRTLPKLADSMALVPATLLPLLILARLLLVKILQCMTGVVIPLIVHLLLRVNLLSALTLSRSVRSPGAAIVLMVAVGATILLKSTILGKPI
jgi:hypothetical protein